MRKVLFYTDTHTMHILGLTPPDYWRADLIEIQRVGYEFYLETIDIVKPDALICMGDIKDVPKTGRSARQHLVTDEHEGTEMSIQLIEKANVDNYIFIAGTPAHTETMSGETEKAVASHFNHKLYDKKKIEINGLILSLKHTITKSMTMPKNVIRNDYVKSHIEKEEPANIHFFGHIHNYKEYKDKYGHVVTLPGMQFMGCAYGRRLMNDADYDYGMCWIEIDDDGRYQVYSRILNLTTGKKEKIIKL